MSPCHDDYIRHRPSLAPTIHHMLTTFGLLVFVGTVPARDLMSPCHDDYTAMKALLFLGSSLVPSPLVVLVSRLLFGRRSVRSEGAARAERRVTRARRARRACVAGGSSPPQSSRGVRALRALLLLLLASSLVPSVAPRAPLPRSTRAPARRARGGGGTTSGRADARRARHDARGGARRVCGKSAFLCCRSSRSARRVGCVSGLVALLPSALRKRHSARHRPHRRSRCRSRRCSRNIHAARPPPLASSFAPPFAPPLAPSRLPPPTPRV